MVLQYHLTDDPSSILGLDNSFGFFWTRGRRSNVGRSHVSRDIEALTTLRLWWVSTQIRGPCTRTLPPQTTPESFLSFERRDALISSPRCRVLVILVSFYVFFVRRWATSTPIVARWRWSQSEVGHPVRALHVPGGYPGFVMFLLLACQIIHSKLNKIK